MKNNCVICESAYRILKDNGIMPEDITAFAYVDMDACDIYSEGYLVLTENQLVRLWGENFEGFELSKIQGMRVEELISSCRLCIESDGNEKLISYFSFSCKDDAYRLVRFYEKRRDNEIISEDDIIKESFCPKCGMRYADSERKFCINCMDKGRIIKRMSVFFLKYKLKMLIILLLLVVMSALAVITPYISSGFYYDEVLSADGNFFGQIVFVLTIIISLRIFRLLVNVFNDIVSTKISALIVNDIKKTIFKSIERLSVSFFTNRSTGGLMNQVNNDSNRIYWFFVDGLPVIVINAVQFITVFIIMMCINPLLTVLSLLMAPVVAILIGKLFRHSQKLHFRRYSKERAMNSLLSDLLTGIRVVKTFSREKTETKRFDKASTNLARESKKISLFSGTAFPMVNQLVYLGVIVVWGVGGWMIIDGSFGLTYGMLLTFIAYIGMIYDPLYSFVNMMQSASESFSAMSRLFEIMDAVPEVKQSEHPVKRESFEGRVTFNNVKFSYVKNRRILDGISFDIAAGGNIGIVGHTGVGKSTIANLIMRLYDVEEGEILIDGVNVKDMSFEDLHKNIAIVSQETYLFVGTILENIRYACPEATNADVVRAAKAAGAHDFIIKLPEGYETKVGFGYKELSGGEKQRVSIARALLRDPKILILDEATAAMDTQTERQIQDTLDELSKTRTTITIAHRLSTLRNADYLIVIKDKKMPEYGSPAELIRKRGIYYNLYMLQLEALKNAGIAE